LVHLRVIEEPERRGVGAEEVPDCLVVYLDGREPEDELPLRMLKRQRPKQSPVYIQTVACLCKLKEETD
jgi:hypothetical protein